MKTQISLVLALAALVACDANNDPGAMNANPVTTGAGNDGSAESGAGQNAGVDGMAVRKEAEAPLDAMHEDVLSEAQGDAPSGCSCSEEDAGVYRMSLACFCKGDCTQKYDPARPGLQFCGSPIDPPNPNTYARLTNYSSCSLVGVAFGSTDVPPRTWFFDANTNKLVGVIEGSNLFQQYDTRCVDAGAMHYTVVAGLLPTCEGTFVRDLCAKQDASASSDGQ